MTVKEAHMIMLFVERTMPESGTLSKQLSGYFNLGCKSKEGMDMVQLFSHFARPEDIMLAGLSKIVRVGTMQYQLYSHMVKHS